MSGISCSRFGRNEHGDVLSNGLLSRIPVDPLRPRVPGGNRPINGVAYDGVGGGHDNRRQLRINSFGLLEFGNVGENSVSQQRAVLLEGTQGAVAHPNPVAILVTQAIFQVENFVLVK